MSESTRRESSSQSNLRDIVFKEDGINWFGIVERGRPEEGLTIDAKSVAVNRR